MILYGTTFSPFALRILLVAWAKGHDLELVPPPGEGRAPEFRAINPLGKIPCLVDEDLVLPESEVIANYLDDVLSGPKLWPEDPVERAREARVVKIADHYVSGGFHRLILARMAGVTDVTALAQHQASIGSGIAALDHFASGGQWLTDRGFGHGDALLIPVLGMASFFARASGFDTLVGKSASLTDYWSRVQHHQFLAPVLAQQSEGFHDFTSRRGVAI